MMWFGLAVEDGYEFGLFSDGKYIEVKWRMEMNFVWDPKDGKIGAGLCCK